MYSIDKSVFASRVFIIGAWLYRSSLYALILGCIKYLVPLVFSSLQRDEAQIT